LVAFQGWPLRPIRDMCVTVHFLIHVMPGLFAFRRGSR
jgi:hypothetical protein